MQYFKTNIWILDDCPPNKPVVRCIINSCDHETCPNLPPAECQLDVCTVKLVIFNGYKIIFICCLFTPI